MATISPEQKARINQSEEIMRSNIKYNQKQDLKLVEMKWGELNPDKFKKIMESGLVELDSMVEFIKFKINNIPASIVGTLQHEIVIRFLQKEIDLLVPPKDTIFGYSKQTVMIIMAIIIAVIIASRLIPRRGR
jgi:hypothetical protein